MKIMVLWPWEPKQCAIFVALRVFCKLDYNLSLWIPDELSSLSGAEIMAHKPKIGYKFKSHKR